MKEEESRKTLLAALRRAVIADPVKTVLVDMTPLGLVELTRKKIRRPLHEQVRWVREKDCRVRKSRINRSGERMQETLLFGHNEKCYSSAITSSCFHIHENKKLGGSTICWFGWKSAYASKLATHFLIQTSAWLNCNRKISKLRKKCLTIQALFVIVL